MDELTILKDVASMAGASYTITQSFKMAGMDSKYAMLVSIVVGVGLSFAFGLNPAFGLMSGLSASGTFSGVKSIGVATQKEKQEAREDELETQ